MCALGSDSLAGIWLAYWSFPLLLHYGHNGLQRSRTRAVFPFKALSTVATSRALRAISHGLFSSSRFCKRTAPPHPATSPPKPCLVRLLHLPFFVHPPRTYSQAVRERVDWVWVSPPRKRRSSFFSFLSFDAKTSVYERPTSSLVSKKRKEKKNKQNEATTRSKQAESGARAPQSRFATKCIVHRALASLRVPDPSNLRAG
ncbi:hypothetical protein DFH11DRAFT_98275 [Phellopilus nigrolimitatus]|nr:hypothetical protein DFH11DRAFT_98275 [Phellopilus nigrolimitatus]